MRLWRQTEYENQERGEGGWKPNLWRCSRWGGSVWSHIASDGTGGGGGEGWWMKAELVAMQSMGWFSSESYSVRHQFLRWRLCHGSAVARLMEIRPVMRAPLSARLLQRRSNLINDCNIHFIWWARLAGAGTRSRSCSWGMTALACGATVSYRSLYRRYRASVRQSRPILVDWCRFTAASDGRRARHRWPAPPFTSSLSFI